jgi:hypothetical protein
MLFIKSHLYLEQPKYYNVLMCNKLLPEMRCEDYIDYGINIIEQDKGVNIVELFIQYMKNCQKKQLKC